MRVVATAGHVDHGKSSLVHALTGTDPDRFPEEKERGLTIDLGFAFTMLPSGQEIGFVDVPGHVRFIKNMLAGVGAVDVVLLVVAANEGWMPQSEEHLRIVELLGVRHGVAALTKADTVDDETVELARLELDEHLTGSSMAGAPVVVCDSVSGRGLDGVRAALDTALGGAPSPTDQGRPRLWIDRVFAAKGAGTVVTGTLTGGSLRVDDEVGVGAPARPARVRAIESAHRQVESIAPGSRVALNLAGIDHGEIARGDAVVRTDQWVQAAVFDVSLQPVGDKDFPKRARVQCYVGSGEHEGHLRVLDDGRRFGRLRLERPVPLAPGDHLVLRDPGRRRTVGGAEILDVAPEGRARDAPARLALPQGRRLLATHPWLEVKMLGPLAGAGPDQVVALAGELERSGDAVRVDRWLVGTKELGRVRELVAGRVEVHHRDHPLEPGVEVRALAAAAGVHADQLRAALMGAEGMVVERGIVRLASHRGRVADSPEAQQLIAELAAEPFSPPDPISLGVDLGLVRTLVREGALIDLDGIVFAAIALDQARGRVQEALRERGALTVADARDLLGSTRKFVLPILNRLDHEGVTRRRGDERIPGAATLRG